ncbi:unnamed protein product, partial [Allacma fusca]
IGYKSNLIVYLTFPVNEVLPSTFQELAKDLKYNIVFADTKGAGMVFLRSSTSPAIMSIANRMTIYEDNDRLRCVMNVVIEPNFICLEMVDAGTSLISRNLTLIRSISVVDRSSETALS